MPGIPLPVPYKPTPSSVQTLPPAARKYPPPGEQPLPRSPDSHSGLGKATGLATSTCQSPVSLPTCFGPSLSPKLAGQVGPSCLPSRPQAPLLGTDIRPPRVAPVGSTSHFTLQASPSEPEPHNGLDEDLMTLCPTPTPASGFQFVHPPPHRSCGEHENGTQVPAPNSLPLPPG